MTALVSRLPPALLVVVLGTAVLAGGSRVGAAEATVGLGTAGSFAVLAGTTVTNTGPSVISGDLGVSPGTAVTGFPPGTVSNGTIHAGDAVAANAQADTTTAYNDAAGRSPTANVSADLAGQTFVSGVYRGPTLGLTGTVTLDAQGDPTAVFIFQAGSTLITGSASRVSLVNGADACNVFWQVGSSATLGTDSVFAGTILALTSVTVDTRASVAGRLLARNGAVTLDHNTVTRPNCAPPPTTTTTTTTTVPTTATTTPATTSTTTPVALPLVGTDATSTTSAKTKRRTTAAGSTTGASRRGTSTAASTRGTTGTSAGADRSSATGRDVPLARTGSELNATAVTGVLAIVLGALTILASRAVPPGKRKAPYRC